MPVVNSDFLPQFSRLKGKKALLLFPMKDKIKRKHHQSPELSKKKEPQWTFHFGVVAVEKLTCCQRYSLKHRKRKNTLVLSLSCHSTVWLWLSLDRNLGKPTEIQLGTTWWFSWQKTILISEPKWKGVWKVVSTFQSVLCWRSTWALKRCLMSVHHTQRIWPVQLLNICSYISRQ